MLIEPAGGSRIRRPVHAATVAVTLGLLLGACSGSDSGDEPTVTSLATTPSAVETGPASTVDASPTTADAGEPSATGTDVQGHRGARGLRPENTLPAFEVALDLGVTTLEMDLHVSADGIVMVWHDPVVDPAKCGLDPSAATTPPDPDDPATTSENLMIANLTATEIAGYRCDRNPDPGRFPDQRPDPGALAVDDYSIPTLDEVFAFVEEYAASELKTDAQRTDAASVQFNIETKRRPDDPATIGDGFDGANPGPFEREVLAAVVRAGVLDRTTVQSFDHRSLWAMRSLDETVSLAALTLRGQIPDFAALAANGAVIWSPDYRSLSEDLVAEAHAAGLAVIPWTVNDPSEMQTLIDLGVDGIITDRPDLAPPS